MTQSELAVMSGLNQQSISDYENNHRRPSLKASVAISKALGISAEELYEAIQEQGEDERVAM